MIRAFWTLGFLVFWAGIPGWALSQETSSHSGGDSTPKGNGTIVDSGPSAGSRVQAGSATLLAPDQFATVMTRFEKETLDEVEKLDSTRISQDKLQTQIQFLESKAKALRGGSRNSLNVFEDAKLKACLSDLQQKLEENSKLEKQYQLVRTDFEQKALSLLSLYNDWIDANLVPPPDPTPASLDERLNALALVAKKRVKLQFLLRNYRLMNEREPTFKPSDFSGLDPQDKEGRRLALDLLRDRKKTLGDSLDRLALEQEEIRNEIKLQGKLQDFLEDIQKMNEDSSFPRGSLRRNDLQSYMGKTSRNSLEGRIAQLEVEIAKGRQSLAQMDSAINRLESGAGEKKGGQP